MQVAGFVLVGGRCLRMGRDKARLPLGSHSLVEDASAKLSAVAQNVALLGEPDKYKDLPFDCVPDCRPGLGPLAGIEAALLSRRGELNVIVACDIPGIESAWLRELVAAARKGRFRCVVTRDGQDKIQPLLAVYHRSSLPEIQDALNHNRLRVLDVIARLRPGYCTIPDTLHNVNTPVEWAAWQSRGAGLANPRNGLSS